LVKGKGVWMWSWSAAAIAVSRPARQERTASLGGIVGQARPDGQ
jgi:hypothetical protein